MDYTIRDSSVWQDSDATGLLYEKDCAVRFGIVREQIFVEDFAEIRYVVEVWDSGNTIPVTCMRTSRFGGVYNYEEYTLQDFQAGNSTASSAHAVQPGDHVVIAYANGDSREGFIMGYLNHSGRAEALTQDDGIAYKSEFNGLEQTIANDGAYRVTYKGVATNASVLSEAPTGEPIPPAEFDEQVGGSYFEFDNTGSFLLTDNGEQTQSIFIDKAGGMIVVTGGESTLTINSAEGSYEITNKMMTVTAEDAYELTSKEVKIAAETSYTLESGKIEIMGETTHMGNVELTGNLMMTGNTVQTGNHSVTGGLAVTGPVALAGGASPLIVDIILIKGTGNLGAPVISTAQVRTTALTKAS